MQQPIKCEQRNLSYVISFKSTADEEMCSIEMVPTENTKSPSVGKSATDAITGTGDIPARVARAVEDGAGGFLGEISTMTCCW